MKNPAERRSVEWVVSSDSASSRSGLPLEPDKLLSPEASRSTAAFLTDAASSVAFRRPPSICCVDGVRLSAAERFLRSYRAMRRGAQI